MNWDAPNPPPHRFDNSIPDGIVAAGMYPGDELEPDSHPMRLYLAGPMSGLPEYNFPAFVAAAARLRAAGYEVWSPAENDLRNGFDPSRDTAQPLREYMKHDLPAVLASDALVVLPGWSGSKGALLEAHAATACGIPVLDVETLFPIEIDLRVEKVDGPSPAPTETILEEAGRLVHGARGEDYGHPIEDFTRTGIIWGAILGFGAIKPSEVALCLIGLKMSREVHRPKRDNRTDIAGYAETLDMVREREAGR